MPQLAAGPDTDGVRALIDVSLTADDLPDTTILSDIFAGRADDRISLWVARLGANIADDDPKLHRAAVVLTAALLARQVPFLLSERLPDYQYQRQAAQAGQSHADMANDLAGEAMRLVIDAVNNIAYPQPVTFAVAAGRRGWSGPTGVATGGPVPTAYLWGQFGGSWW